MFIFLTALAVFFVLRANGVELSYAQVLSLPLFLIGIYKIFPRAWRLSRSTMVVVFVLGISGVALSYNAESFSQGGIVVARFDDDPMENESRVFRTKLDDFLAKMDRPGVIRHPFPIKDKKSARKFLEDEDRTVVIWGNSHWLTVSLQSKDNRTLGSLLGTDFSKFGIRRWSDLVLIQSPSWYRIGLGKDIASDVFLSYELSGEVSSSTDYKESFLLAAAYLRSYWNSNSHRAFPIWRMGNQYLLDALRSNTYEPGEIECALAAYQKAASYLDKPSMNQELHSAILNNHALALYFKSVFENKPDLKAQAVRELMQVKSKRRRFNKKTYDVNVLDPTRRNLEILYRLGEYKSEKRSRKSEKAIKKGTKRKRGEK